MKTPYLEQWQRECLKNYRDKTDKNPPLFIERYELSLVQHKFCKSLKEEVGKRGKLLIAIMIIIMTAMVILTSCMPTVESRVHECVIQDKHHNFFTGYWFESRKDTSVLFIQVSRKEYKYYEAGDTIK